MRDLVGHATGSAAKIATLLEGGDLWRRSEPDADFDALRTSPEGDVPLHRALTFPVSDLALHSWDLHRSNGRMIELPDDLLDFCHEFVDSLPEDMLRRPGGFGPAQPAPDDASATTRLMAHLGRSVGTVEES